MLSLRDRPSAHAAIRRSHGENWNTACNAVTYTIPRAESRIVNSGNQSPEEELRRAEERFRLVVESSPAGVVIVGTDGRIVHVNQTTENWFGYTRDELIGQEVEVLVPRRHHERHRQDRAEYLADPQTRLMGASRNLHGRRKDGSEFPVDISLHPLRTDQGILVMAYVADLTDRRQAELEMQRRHSMERLALLGQLAASVSHEIRNPLGVIRNATYYLEMISTSLDEEARASIAEIQREVARANHIVGDLLDYARDAPQSATTFDLVSRVRHLARIDSPNGDSVIEVEARAESLPVLADAYQVDRILGNLIRNGVQASARGSRIAITIDADANWAIVDVSDEGAGIDEADRPHVFEPLFTTKAKGIGLGLAVSRRYAERNNGSLELVDRPGPGATFRLTLPRPDVSSGI